MVPQNGQEETTNSENPLQCGTNLKVVKNPEETFREMRRSRNHQTNQKMTQKQAMILGQSKGSRRTSSSALRAARRNFPNTTDKYIDVTRTTHTNLDVFQESRNDCWNVDVDRSLSDSWTGFTKFTILYEKNAKRSYVVRGAAYKKFKQPLDLIACGQKYGPAWPTSVQKREKHPRAIERTKARQCSEIVRHLFYRSG